MQYQLTYKCNDVEFMARLNAEVQKLLHAMIDTTDDAAKKRSAMVVAESGKIARVGL